MFVEIAKSPADTRSRMPFRISEPSLKYLSLRLGISSLQVLEGRLSAEVGRRFGEAEGDEECTAGVSNYLGRGRQ